MFNTDPTLYLPHRYPFLFLDRITSLAPGASAEAVHQVTHNEFFSQILLIEAIAQLAGVATVQNEGEGGFLATIDHAEFFEMCNPGDTLRFGVKVVKNFGRLFILEGEALVSDRPVMKATITLGVGKL
ncbi:MAG: beta-hydroxyacyl-ACP dehydratase [Desulfuromonadales bacterium]|nr:beta-hydroxyacyl-ACP dehydratase [Desulfuromonadales bacterium]